MLRHLGQLDVDGGGSVVEGRRPEDDSTGAHDASHHEDPQEETVQHHRHVPPVVLDLESKGCITELERYPSRFAVSACIVFVGEDNSRYDVLRKFYQHIQSLP